MTDQYAVFGNPIAQSRSPNIHTQFAEQTQQDLNYEKQLIPIDQFEKCVRDFFSAGGKGLNVTVPFKVEAFELADELSPRAQRAGAANFLAINKNGKIVADNTDGLGMIKDMHNLGWSLNAKKILILGAGGAVRGVLQPLLQENPAELVIANRTESKAEELAQEFRDIGKVSACTYENLSGKKFDLIINGTSASLNGELPPLPNGILNSNACAYDMMYGAKPTPFLRWAKENNAAHCADGLGMLVNQAAEAFFLWRGIRPEVATVITDLRKQLT